VSAQGCAAYCGEDAIWRFLDEQENTIDVIGPDCGRYPIARQNSIQANLICPNRKNGESDGKNDGTLEAVSMTAARHRISALEALMVFAIIMGYIWKLRSTHPWFWVWVVALIVASHVAHRERAKGLGFRAGNFAHCVRKFGLPLIALAVAMLGAGLWLGTFRSIGGEGALRSFGLYLPWGLFQQYLLNGYFLKRFDMALSQNSASILTAGLFGVVHSPNWFLMLITPVAGHLAICIYRRYRNLYFLGLAHAIIGFLLFVVVPDSVSHHLRVGPGWSSDTVSAAMVVRGEKPNPRR